MLANLSAQWLLRNGKVLMRKEKRSCQEMWEVHSLAWIVSFLWVGCCWSDQPIIQWPFGLLLEKRFFCSPRHPPLHAHTPAQPFMCLYYPKKLIFRKKHSSNQADTQLDPVVQHVAQPGRRWCQKRWVKEVGAEEGGTGVWSSPFQHQPDLCQIKVTVQPRPLWVAP